MNTNEQATARHAIENAVLERAQHTSKAKAQDTWSFARAERLLGKEYHGRFLIELLQNAADAWRAEHADDSTCELVVVIDDSPALMVANKGAPFPAWIVLESLGQIGLSSKQAGEAIGHKGIGFKSTLEVSLTPEIYSMFIDAEPTLAVKFDPAQAHELICSQTSEWVTWVAEQDEFARAPLRAVPVLRYPTWVDSPPGAVTELGRQGYDTVIRLPHSAAVGDTGSWLAKVRGALGDVSDQILVLLGIFDRVHIEDRIAGTTEEIAVRTEPGERSNGIVTDKVIITRNGVCTSQWVRSHRQYADGAELASEVTAAVRLDAEDSRRPVPAHEDPESSSPFHLFFPTRIGSGLPFLLHGYFEVDAARTGFYAGSAEQNQAILNALADLLVHAVGDLAWRDDIDLVALAELVASTPPPEAKLARQFHERVLRGLDQVAWFPSAPGDGVPRALAPRDILPADKAVTEGLVRVFPVGYLRERSKREVAHPELSARVHRFLADRFDNTDELWPALHAILRPGRGHPWPGDERADQHFIALLDLADALRRLDPKPADELLRGLHGDDEARLVPVGRPLGRREFVPVPNPEGSTARARGVSVMARLGATTIQPLDPPEALDVEFLPDGMLTDQTRPRAEAFGIRPFTVDAVLDRLNIPEGTLRDDHDRQRLVHFLWDLLTRERRSDFSTASSGGYALSFASHRWFWLQPGRARQDENARLRQRRERNLADVPLPARDGTWRPSGKLAFGADWADWVETHLPHADGARRAAAMRRLERLAPNEGSLHAPPETVLSHLTPSSIKQPPTRKAFTDDAGEADASIDTAEPEEVDQTKLVPLEQFGFLLRLGCWEVLPVEGHESGRAEADRVWPWPELRNLFAPEEAAQEWNFEGWQWSGSGHRNITVTEDARLQWPLDHGDHGTRLAMAAALTDGASLYGSLTEASALCPRCSTPAGNYHSKLYRTHDGDRRPSTLALQLRRQRWLPTTRAGVPIEAHAADEVWADPRGLDTHAMRTSPLQHLPLVNVTGWPASLRTLCGVQSLDDADAARLLRLHDTLRAALEHEEVHLTTGTARQSFVGLHRLIYEALSNRQTDEHIPDDFEVLCELGSRLVHRRPSECRHDDGKYVGYRARFAGRVPYVVLGRDKGNIAKALGIPTFEVSVIRRDADLGQDITDSLREELTERIPELLAVMVHYASGTNPLEPTSDAFRDRANRLSNLRVKRLDNLVLTVSVVGLPDVQETIGDTTQDESYLDTSRPGLPVVFHDFTGDGWRGRLRRRLAQHLAAVSDVAGAYADTFTLLLTADDEEREDLLRSWGVAAEHVQQIRTQLGIFTDSDRTRAANWLTAILTVLDRKAPGHLESLDHAQVTSRLVEAGLTHADADAVAHGITTDRPGDPAGPVLRTLNRHGVDLRALSGALADQHEPRLAIHIARDRLQEWRDRHGPRLVAVLTEAGAAEDAAKTEVHAMAAPAELDYALDPAPEEYLAPVVTVLRRRQLDPDGTALVADARVELASLVGWGTSQLDERVRELYDDEARAARLRDLARGWARELRLLSLLVRANGASATVVRSEATQADERIGRPGTPSELIPLLDELVPGDHLAGLRRELSELLVDDLPGTPADRGRILDLAETYDLPVASVSSILKTLNRDRSKRVATYTHQVRALVEHRVQPRPPTGLAPPPPPRQRMGGRKTVSPGKVSVDIERRKKKAGDEAESWALTAMTKTLLDMEPSARDRAIQEIVTMLDEYGFEGAAIERVHEYADASREAHLDDEELVDRLTQFLYVAAYSDEFGFDLLGWIAEESSPEWGHPMALEVKAASGSFYFSRGEWACAERMRATEESSSAYAVLAVRRRSGSDVPVAMDLLIDPVHLYNSGQISREDDTYRMWYTPTEG